MLHCSIMFGLQLWFCDYADETKWCINPWISKLTHHPTMIQERCWWNPPLGFCTEKAQRNKCTSMREPWACPTSWYNFDGYDVIWHQMKSFDLPSWIHHLGFCSFLKKSRSNGINLNEFFTFHFTLQAASRFFDPPLIWENGRGSPVFCWSNWFFTDVHASDNGDCFASLKKLWNLPPRNLTSVTFQAWCNHKQDLCSVFCVAVICSSLFWPVMANRWFTISALWLQKNFLTLENRADIEIYQHLQNKL